MCGLTAYCSWSCSPTDKCPTQVSLSVTSRKQKADLSSQQYKEETLNILQLCSYDKGVRFQCMILKIDVSKYVAVPVVMEVQQKFVMEVTKKKCYLRTYEVRLEVLTAVMLKVQVF